MTGIVIKKLMYNLKLYLLQNHEFSGRADSRNGRADSRNGRADILNILYQKK